MAMERETRVHEMKQAWVRKYSKEAEGHTMEMIVKGVKNMKNMRKMKKKKKGKRGKSKNNLSH